MEKFKVGDVVEFVETMSVLDGKTAKVVGFYGVDSNGPIGVIVWLLTDIVGFDPALVITPASIRKT